MFLELSTLVAKKGPINLKVFPGTNGKIKVVVTPNVNVKQDSALSHPLILSATPEELDAGFAEAILTYSAALTSLQDQVTATETIIDAAKKQLSDKAVNAVKGNSSKSSSSVQFEDDGEPSDDNNENENGSAVNLQPKREPVVVEPVAEGTDLSSLF